MKLALLTTFRRIFLFWLELVPVLWVNPLITGTSSDQAKKATQRFQLFSAKILADIITPSREEGAAWDFSCHKLLPPPKNWCKTHYNVLTIIFKTFAVITNPPEQEKIMYRQILLYTTLSHPGWPFLEDNLFICLACHRSVYFRPFWRKRAV